MKRRITGESYQAAGCTSFAGISHGFRSGPVISLSIFAGCPASHRRRWHDRYRADVRPFKVDQRDGLVAFQVQAHRVLRGAPTGSFGCWRFTWGVEIPRTQCRTRASARSQRGPQGLRTRAGIPIRRIAHSRRHPDQARASSNLRAIKPFRVCNARKGIWPDSRFPQIPLRQSPNLERKRRTAPKRTSGPVNGASSVAQTAIPFWNRSVDRLPNATLAQ